MAFKILNFPNRRQTYNFDCGCVAFQSVLAYYGIDVRGDKLMKKLKTTKGGTDAKEMVKVAKEYGLKYKQGAGSPDILRHSIDNGYPIIIAVQAWRDGDKKDKDWTNEWDEGHWVTVIGYGEGKFLFEDPSSVERVYLKEKELMDRWHDGDKHGKRGYRFGLIIWGKKPKYSNINRIQKMG